MIFPHIFMRFSLCNHTQQEQKMLHMNAPFVAHSMKGRTKIHASSENESIMSKNQFIKICSLLLAILMICSVGVLSTSATQGGSIQEVYVGGMPFGVKFNTEGVLVVGFCDVETSSTQGQSQKVNPAKDAGMHIKDIITHIDATPITGAADLTGAVERSQGKPMTLTVKRKIATSVKRNLKSASVQDADSTQTLTFQITPAYCPSEGRYKTGLWVKDSGAGIGTVTFIVPGSNAFAGLGHGICDGDTGELIPMQRGQVMDVTISGIEKGLSGDPGAIKGYFAPGKTGTLLGNTNCGVFGVYATLPKTARQKVAICNRNQVKEGAVTILCTLDDGNMGSYTATISSIDRQAKGSKCFTVTVTDPTLLEKTGGIVQGMSGSPILQDGKLVGAVTHVLVNDPTTGYGIFVDNMLTGMPELLK